MNQGHQSARSRIDGERRLQRKFSLGPAVGGCDSPAGGLGISNHPKCTQSIQLFLELLVSWPDFITRSFCFSLIF